VMITLLSCDRSHSRRLLRMHVQAVQIVPEMQRHLWWLPKPLNWPQKPLSVILNEPFGPF
jgi:hypothetical protein